MYLVLTGSLRVRQMIGQKETVITTLKPGEFFGDISLFDDGPRSADVIANEDSVLLKITESTFEALTQKMPEVATPFLMALGRSMSGRIRADNERHKKDLLVMQATKTN
jgi:CRP-like cAMP-binding protein